MNNKNKFGLSRYITKAIREEIRKRSGYGCVVCRKIPYDYDHFKKGFAASETHDPNDIILLCPNHHRAKENGQISPAKIDLRLREIRKGDPQYLAELLSDYFNIYWPAGNMFPNFSSGIKINGKSAFEIERTGNAFDPVHFSFVTKDKNNEVICVVEKNAFEFRENKIGDLTLEGSQLVLKDDAGEIIIDININHHGIYIKKMRIIQDGCYILANQNALTVGNSDACVSFNNLLIASQGFEPHDVISVWKGREPLRFDGNDVVLPEHMHHRISTLGFTVPPGQIVFDVGNPKNRNFIFGF